MKDFHQTRSANIWMQKVFDAKSARQGRVVRRSLRDIDNIVGRERFETEIRRRGYHAVRNGDQVVVFCNNQPVQVMC
jgi:Trk K+ transport system NAD-binding subunit